MRILIFFTLFFSSLLNAQLTPQTQPTQPQLQPAINPKPAPSQLGCVGSFSQCMSASYTNLPATQIFEAACSPYDDEFLKFLDNSTFVCNDGIEPEQGVLPDFPVECYSCACDENSIRVDGICVPNQSCSTGIRDFVTGACYPESCPFGDGTPISCGLAPACIASENASLITNINPTTGTTTNSCVCPTGTTWNADTLQCALPNCAGLDGSPLNSFLDLSTFTCECSITAILDTATNSCVENSCSQPLDVFNPVTRTCSQGLSCPKNYDLNTTTNTCYKITNDAHDCQLFSYPFPSQHVNPEQRANEDANALEQRQVLVDQCTFAKSAQYESYVHFLFTEIGGDHYYMSLFSPQEFCTSRSGVWNQNLNTCMNGQVQPPPENIANWPFNSSSSSSQQSSSSEDSSSEISSYSSSSVESGTGSGGAGGSSGSGVDSGGGGGGGPGGASGGGSGSVGAGSSSTTNVNISSANNTQTNSSQNTNAVSSARAASTPNNTGSIASTSTPNTNTSTPNTNASTPNSGGGTSSGSGGGGGGGSGGDNGSNTSSGSNTSTNSNSSNPTFNQPTGDGVFDATASEQLITELTTELKNKIETIKSEISTETSVTLTTNETVQDKCWEVRGVEVCLGFSRWTQYMQPIPNAILLLASILAFFIVIRR